MREKFASSQFKDFNILDEIYRSRFGIVYKAEFKYDKKVYVLKERKIAELGQQKDVLNEVKLLQQLRHVNIVQCEGWFRDVDRKSLFIVLEYCEGGDLFQFLERRRKNLVTSDISARRIPNYLEEREIWYIFSQICSGLRHLHENGIIHRDIKTLNILLTNNNRLFKIGDLGVSRQVSENTFLLNTFYGTPLYLSPELIENKSYNEKTDIWSLGIILYELCALKPPFTGNSFPELTSKVLRGEYDPIPEKYSKSLTSCIGWLLTKEYQKRPNICQVIEYVEGKVDKTYHGNTLTETTTPTTTGQQQSSSSAKLAENPPVKKESKSKLVEAPPSRPRSPPPPEKKIPATNSNPSTNVAKAKIEPEAGGGNDTDEDIENDSLDGKDDKKAQKKNGNSRSRPTTAGDAVIISAVKKLEINPPKLILPTNLVPEQQSPNEDSDGTISVTSQEFATRNSVPNKMDRPKSAHRPKTSKGESPQPISIPDEMVEIDTARIHAKHRREIIKYRKLLQMRDFINDSLGNNDDKNPLPSNGKKNDQQHSNSKVLLSETQQKLAELKAFINILEEAMDKKKILKSIAIRYNLPFIIPKVIQFIPQQEISERERIVDDSLPIYLQQPPSRRDQKNIQNYVNPPYSPFGSPRRQERNGKGRPQTAGGDGLQVQKEIILQHLWGDAKPSANVANDLHVNPHFPSNSPVIVGGGVSGKEKNNRGAAASSPRGAAVVVPGVIYENNLINVFDQKHQKQEKHRKDLFHDLQDSPVTPRSQLQQQELSKQYHHQIQQPKQARPHKSVPNPDLPPTTPADYVNNDNGLLLPSMKVKPKHNKHSKFIELNNLPVPNNNQPSIAQTPWNKPPGPPQQQAESSSNNKREISPPPSRPKSAAAARVYSRPGSNQRPTTAAAPQQNNNPIEMIASDKKRLYHHNRVISDVTSYKEVQQVYKDHQANNINLTDLLHEDDENHFIEHLQLQQQAVVGMKIGEPDTTDDEIEHHQQRKNFRRQKVVEIAPEPQQQQQPQAQQLQQRPQTSGGVRRRLPKEEDENGVIDVKFQAHDERKHQKPSSLPTDDHEEENQPRRNKTRIDRMILRKQRSEFNIITGV